MSSSSIRRHLSMPGMLRAMRDCFDLVPDPLDTRGITPSDCLISGLPKWGPDFKHRFLQMSGHNLRT